MAPAMIPSQPFPIAAAVAAGMAVVVAGAIIVVFSMSQKRRRQQTPGRPAAAAGGPVNQAPTVQARGVTFQLPFPDLESRRADGSTISISSPVELQNAH
ncbi:hypothetical protein B0H16DRAFT_1691722 [Mycena metata]|uniref:Uncharacterized protein n=1 Tax=Mycena metata TaxID=1033252 RepID=A0AAD7IW36_9AGAR|nr:hypothetical protein B0H16DRAFT_1691722 [Mycena metata]